MTTVLYIIPGIMAVLVILYLLAVMPRIGHRSKSRELAAVYYAHRGLHDNHGAAPENSMKAFCRAVEAGYGIELDVQLSKDRIPVVFHDFTAERVCGREGKICDYTWQELSCFKLCGSEETIPRFEEVLKLVDGRVPLIVEFKAERLDVSVCPAADRLLKKYQGLYCIESFNPLALLWYRRKRKDIVRGQLSDAFTKSGEFKGLLYYILQNLLLNWLTKPDFVAYNHKYASAVSRRICRRLYKNMAAAWTIKSQEELNAAKKEFDVFIFDSFIPDSGPDILKQLERKTGR